jgi:hypothetical protein
MEVHKDARWRVRGELEFDKPITLQGRRYRLVDTVPYENSKGCSGELLVWRGNRNLRRWPGKFRQYHIGGNVRFRVQSALDVIEDATGERPDPWSEENGA